MEINEIIAKHLEERFRVLDVAYANISSELFIVIKGLSLKKFEREVLQRTEARIARTEFLKNATEAVNSAKELDSFRDMIDVMGTLSLQISGSSIPFFILVILQACS